MYAVIMAGGSGKRFWPLSRKQMPKQFLDITGKGPMVVETCDRLSPVASEREIVLVLGEGHLARARDLFQGREVHMVAEPVGRNTAACIGLGALYAAYLGCKDPVAFLPADHYIGDPDAFVETLRVATRVAAEGGISTLGIVPTRPETGYGYIRRGRPESRFNEGRRIYGVSAFVEKPDLKTASRYLASGEYYWNSGIFVATPETILRELRNHLPSLHEGLMRVSGVLGSGRLHEELEAVYEGLESISFDHGVMEKTGEQVYLVPCECGWSDVGSWASLYALRGEEKDEGGILSEGDTLLLDCKESFVSARGGRTVTCLGVKNCLVVDTADTVLVADLNRSQEIGKLVDYLKALEREDMI